MMDFIAVFQGLLILSTVQLATCPPPTRFRKWRVLPNPNEGGTCGRTPELGEYCDKFGSLLIKRCSPCNLSQLRNNAISFPEECANLPCPYRCPEEISDTVSPAPSTSCDLTTTSLTTLGTDSTTDLPSTYRYISATITSAPTRASSETTSSFQTTRPSNISDHSAIVWRVLVPLGTVVTVVVVVIVVAITVFYMKKRRCKRVVRTSSSTEPMLAANEIPMTPPSTPTAPVFNPGQTSVEITTRESNMFAKLDCDCAGNPIPIGPEGVTYTLEGLLPSTRYGIVLGTWDDTGFHPRHREVIDTTGETPDISRCNFSLHNLKEYIENNSQDFQYLKAKFGHVKNEDLARLRALSRVLGVTHLTDVVGPLLFEEIINRDSQWKSEEDSIKVFSIQLALRANMNRSAQVPDFVAAISNKLSSIHRDCVPCRHLVCEITRNCSETTV